jgi:hypothetical protein
VEIPKANGGFRKLGIPTVSDRIAQIVAKLIIEPIVDTMFHPDSYGYRPGRSAKRAVAVTRQRCWRYDWVVEFDTKAAFDQIDHGSDSNAQALWLYRSKTRAMGQTEIQNTDAAPAARCGMASKDEGNLPHMVLPQACRRK